MLCLFFRFFWLVLSLTALPTAAYSDYHERLVLQPFPPSALLASFNFRANESLPAFEHQNFRYFPRSLGQILQHTNTRELHLRFNTGRWDPESWGARPWDGTKEGGTGVELWAWIAADSDDEAFAKWIALTQSLSGLFCASLNFVDSTRTTRPAVTFSPSGDHNDTPGSLHLLHGVLPGEVVCTENLTPFLKLLPCKGKAGISGLLDGHKIFDASWQSMAIDVRPVCPQGSPSCLVEIEQTVDMVLDIERAKRPYDNPIPRPVPHDQLVCDASKSYHSEYTCYPVDMTSEPSWSLHEVFGRQIKGSCPLIEEEGPDAKPVCINVPNERPVYISSGAWEFKNSDGNSRCYHLLPAQPFDLSLPQQETNLQIPLNKVVIHAERTTVGHGQERGGIRTILTNPSATEAVEFVYFETLPWFMRPYIHTLKASITGGDFPYPWNVIQETYYRPAIDRHRGTQLELKMSIPPSSTVTLTYDFEKAILRYTEYPPDANRGFNVAPAVIRILGKGKDVYIRTTSLLLPLPTPDFSMPYNVIILTSTVMALAFGSIFNLLVRRFVGADEVERMDLSAFKARIVGRFIAIKDRFSGKAQKVE